MDNANQMENSFSEKMRLYFQNYPGRCCDISFVVGSGDDKEVIQTSRIILEIACPQFMKFFDEKWAQAVVPSRNEESEINGIPLPDVDPKAFKLFLKMLLLEDVSVNSLKALNVPPEILLKLIELCREYKMTKIQENLETVAEDALFGNGFFAFAESDGFLTLSQNYLNSILSSERLDVNETKIFDAAIRWAEKRCSERGIENTGENIREVLGDCLYQIRFPRMTRREFTKCIRSHKILTLVEESAIFKFFATNDESDEEIVLPFNKTKRTGPLFTKLQFFKQYKITNSGLTFCNGSRYHTSRLKVNQEMELHRVGFLGPVVSDSFYDVTVEIYHHNPEGIACGKLEKRVFARKDELFYVSFDQPIKIKASSTFANNDWSNDFYWLNSSIKGPYTSLPETESWTILRTETETENGVGFRHWVYSTSNGPNTTNPENNEWTNLRTVTENGVGFYCRFYRYPLAELCFKKF